VFVEVGAVGGHGGRLDVLGGQPDGLDVVGEGDLAAGVVVPGAVPDFGFLAVGGAFSSTPGGVGADGALPSFRVAVAGNEPGIAVVGDPGLDPRHRCLPELAGSVDVRTVSATVAPKAGEPQRTSAESDCERDLRLYLHTTSVQWSVRPCVGLVRHNEPRGQLNGGELGRNGRCTGVGR
jgi:hypothetical protein